MKIYYLLYKHPEVGRNEVNTDKEKRQTLSKKIKTTNQHICMYVLRLTISSLFCMLSQIGVALAPETVVYVAGWDDRLTTKCCKQYGTSFRHQFVTYVQYSGWLK